MSKLNLILVVMLAVSCKSASPIPLVRQTKTLESIVTEKLGENTVVQKNKDATFALCLKENSSTLSVSYLIVRLSDLTIVEQDKISQASISWIDIYKIEMKVVPGMVKKDEQSTLGKVIDVTKYMVKQ